MTAGVTRGKLAKVHDDIEYFPHQITGVRTLARLPSFILADDMGLGKSLQALTVAAVDFEMGLAKRILVVCPGTLKDNWADEIENFTSFSSHVLRGTETQRADQLEKFDKDVLIVNYEQIKSHLTKLNSMAWDIVIWDEAHYIKNHQSQRTKAAFALWGRRHFLLTGSPILNHADDLWALLHKVDPALFPNYWRFVNRYCVFGGYNGKKVVGIKNERELNEILKGYMLRRLKTDAGVKLPPVQTIKVLVDMTPKQQALYDKVKKERVLPKPTEGTQDDLKEQDAVRFLRLTQVASTTATIEGHEDHSGKLDRAVEIIEETIEAGEPIVVFFRFRTTLECLEKRLLAKGIDFRSLHGDVKSEDRQPIVRAWTEDAKAKRPQALLCMYQVAGVGLNLTAASRCILVDRLFVPKLEDQAIDRLNRIGQKGGAGGTVQVYILVAAKSVEDRIERTLRDKRKVFDEVVDKETKYRTAVIAALREELSS